MKNTLKEIIIVFYLAFNSLYVKEVNFFSVAK